jgi:hypothetical protein
VERLRRKLGGCDTRPFAPLSARPPGRGKAHHERLVAKIRADRGSNLGREDFANDREHLRQPR